MFARHFIDSLDFAWNGRELRGELPVAELPRLQEMLASLEGQISYLVRGYRSKDDKPMLEVTITGSCQLRCQRCMKGLVHPIKIVSRLLLQDERELAESTDEGDEVDSILADSHLDVHALLEEEILLSLPFAPMHPVGVCRAGDGQLAQPEQHPFAVLAKLKQ